MEPKLLAGRYQVSRELARGGMGVVYEAVDRATGRRVAVKVMLASLVSDGDAAARFVREAQACARLDHPRIVPVLDAGSDRGNAYLVMGFLEGDTLQDRIRLEQQIQSRTAVEIAIDLAKVLEYVHSQGILHRDIKPENVILTAHGPVLTDFGIAFDGKSEQERLTQSGTMLGTPGYMPPEQVDGDRSRIDARADVYALGATLFAMLSGRAPFVGGSVINLLRSVLMDAPPKLGSLAPVEPELDLIVQRCLGKEPEERYASARDLREALEAYLVRQAPVAAPNYTLIGAILVLALAIVGAAALLSRGQLAPATPAPSPSLAALPPRDATPQPSPSKTPEPSVTPEPTPQAPDPPREVLVALRSDLRARRWRSLESKLPNLSRAFPRSTQVWTLRGEAALRTHLFQSGAENLEAAEKHLGRALQVDPDYVPALALLTKVRSRLRGDLSSCAKRAIKVGQERQAMACVARAELLQDERRLDPSLLKANLAEEVRLLKRALELDPRSWWGHLDLVARYTTSGRYQEADEIVKKGLLVFSDEPYLYFQRGFFYKMHGEQTGSLASIDAALEAYDTAARLGGPEFPMVFLERGYAHHLRSALGGGDAAHHNQAVADLKSAIQNDPTQPHTHHVLGLIHLKGKSYKSALEAFEGCVALDPSHYSAWTYVVKLREALGDLPGARLAASRALESCPPGNPSRAALSELKRRLDQRR